jgi:hypothetical protein
MALFFSQDFTKWDIKYRDNDNEPYDISALSESLIANEGLEVSKPNSLQDVANLSKKPKSIILLDRLLYLDSDVSTQLKDYLTDGSDVILMADELSIVDDNDLGLEGDLTNEASALQLNLSGLTNQQDLVNLKYWNKGYKEYDHSYFSDEFIQAYKPDIHMYLNNHPVWVSLSIQGSSGRLYLMSCPIVFTNFMMKQDSNFLVSKELYKHLSPGALHLFFEANDKLGKQLKGVAKMDVIFKNPALFMAGCILLIFVGLFLFFAGKRRLSPMPEKIDQESSYVQQAQFISPYYNSTSRRQNLEQKLIYQLDALIFARFGINIQNCTESELAFVANKLSIKPEDLQAIHFEKMLAHKRSKEYYLNLHNQIIKILSKWKK